MPPFAGFSSPVPVGAMCTGVPSSPRRSPAGAGLSQECERVNERLSSADCCVNEADDVCMGYFNQGDTSPSPTMA